MKVTFLGTGTSCGVPMPTCQCEVCTSHDPHDNRLRASVLVETDEGRQILVDCGPDFRYQAIRAGIRHLDGMLLTHNHFDHLGGFDDLRAYAYAEPLETYADEIVSRTLLDKWDYVFGPNRYPGTAKFNLHVIRKDSAQEEEYLSKVQERIRTYYSPRVNEMLSLTPVQSLDESFFLAGQEVMPIRLLHGALPILGYRMGRLAYLTDVTCIPESEWPKLEGVDTLILDALRWKEHPTHWSVSQALEAVRRMQPRQTWFTHMSHDIGLHAEVNTQLPADIQLAYDGQVVEF